MIIDNIDINHSNPFVIAEIGNNHQGSVDRAIAMIDECIDIGVSAVKFQIRDLSSLYRNSSTETFIEDLSVEYTIDLLNKYELNLVEHTKIIEYARQKNICYLCTPWDIVSANFLYSLDIAAYKVSSADLTNLPLIDHLSTFSRPLILSTGMSKTNEIEFIANYLKKKGVDFAFLHCNSTYPAPYHDINLNFLDTLKKIHNLYGYSGHERGISISLAAYSLGCSIIERHYTQDRNLEGPDHSASLEFYEFQNLMSGIHEISQALSIKVSHERYLSQGELMNRENLSKSLIVNKDLDEGEILKYSDIVIKSPGRGLSPLNLNDVINKKTLHSIKSGDFIEKSLIYPTVCPRETYDLKLRWGIPVRYHDFRKFSKLIKPKIFEFHLSYNDLKLNVNDYIDVTRCVDLVVHAPELFNNSMLLDLCSENEELLNDSIDCMKHVINHTMQLIKFFPDSSKPLIVTNVGGFSMDFNISESQKNKCYATLGKTLDLLKSNDYEIIPQTMAPFPWHFGGQRFQNLFVHTSEIVEFCKNNNVHICLDTSHSKLACNYFNYNFNSFCEELSPFVKHIHIGDAKGYNGEGLQIGEGDIDFDSLCILIKNNCHKASFLPEIWQGHKNNGEGFWIALESLNGKL